MDRRRREKRHEQDGREIHSGSDGETAEDPQRARSLASQRRHRRREERGDGGQEEQDEERFEDRHHRHSTLYHKVLGE
jgi:hypothetical protein